MKKKKTVTKDKNEGEHSFFFVLEASFLAPLIVEFIDIFDS